MQKQKLLNCTVYFLRPQLSKLSVKNQYWNKTSLQAISARSSKTIIDIALDDSKSLLFDNSQWVAAQLLGNRVDGYLFAYAHNYRQVV